MSGCSARSAQVISRQIASSSSRLQPAVEGQPAQVKSSTRAAPASSSRLGSLRQAVPVIFAAPTRWPAVARLRTSWAAVVVFPAFIEAPSESTMRGRGAWSGRAAVQRKSRRWSGAPSSPASRPSHSTTVGSAIRSFFDTTSPQTPPMLRMCPSGPRQTAAPSNWSVA